MTTDLLYEGLGNVIEWSVLPIREANTCFVTAMAVLL